MYFLLCLHFFVYLNTIVYISLYIFYSSLNIYIYIYSNFCRPSPNHTSANFIPFTTYLKYIYNFKHI